MDLVQPHRTACLPLIVLQAQPPPGLEGPAFTQAAVESGLLLLLQRTQAVGPADCPGAVADSKGCASAGAAFPGLNGVQAAAPRRRTV